MLCESGFPERGTGCTTTNGVLLRSQVTFFYPFLFFFFLLSRPKDHAARNRGNHLGRLVQKRPWGLRRRRWTRIEDKHWDLDACMNPFKAFAWEERNSDWDSVDNNAIGERLYHVILCIWDMFPMFFFAYIPFFFSFLVSLSRVVFHCCGLVMMYVCVCV